MMNKNKKTIIKKLNLDENKRFIFISDIHGDINLFKQALKESNFNQSDYLFIIGDMIEKGDFLDNIAMMDYILELNKLDNVFFMAGNCDEILRFILPPLDKEKFLYFALDRKKSIINDIAYKLNYELKRDMDVDDFINLVYKNYQKYYDFIDSLPDVMFLNDKLVLVHGGILDINNIPLEAIRVLKFDNFLTISKPQPLTMIVGHYPTRNYLSDIACVNPIFDKKKNIISIDGGNNVVKGGQINIVILNNIRDMSFSYFSLDHYPKYEIKEAIYYEKPKNSYNIQFGKNEVEIITKDLDFYLIKPIDSQDLLWVNEEFITKYNNKYYCFDGCNTFLSLKKGDIVSIIKKAKPYSLIKHNGIIGLIESKYIYED